MPIQIFLVASLIGVFLGFVLWMRAATYDRRVGPFDFALLGAAVLFGSALGHEIHSSIVDFAPHRWLVRLTLGGTAVASFIGYGCLTLLDSRFTAGAPTKRSLVLSLGFLVAYFGVRAPVTIGIDDLRIAQAQRLVLSSDKEILQFASQFSWREPADLCAEMDSLTNEIRFKLVTGEGRFASGLIDLEAFAARAVRDTNIPAGLRANCLQTFFDAFATPFDGAANPEMAKVSKSFRQMIEDPEGYESVISDEQLYTRAPESLRMLDPCEGALDQKKRFIKAAISRPTFAKSNGLVRYAVSSIVTTARTPVAKIACLENLFPKAELAGAIAKPMSASYLRSIRESIEAVRSIEGQSDRAREITQAHEALREEVEDLEQTVKNGQVMRAFMVQKLDSNVYEIRTRTGPAVLVTTGTEFRSRGWFTLAVVKLGRHEMKLKEELGGFDREFTVFREERELADKRKRLVDLKEQLQRSAEFLPLVDEMNAMTIELAMVKLNESLGLASPRSSATITFQLDERKAKLASIARPTRLPASAK